MRKISYKRLWKHLIDIEMNKKTLAEKANISQSTLTKMVNGESVSVELLARICNALNCEFNDIMELIPPEEGR